MAVTGAREGASAAGWRWPLFSERRGTSGPPVVFLHGLAASGRYWGRVAARLPTAAPRAYFVDLLGFGRSPWPDLAYTVADHLGALDAWRSDAGLAGEPLVVVGHSLGALLALEWAARGRDGFAGTVLVSLPAYRDPAAAQRRLARLSLLHRLTFTSRPLARAVCGVMCRYRPLWRLLVPLFAPQYPPAVARDGVLHTWPSVSGTLEHCIFGLTLDHLRRQAAALPRPPAFLHGAADRTAPPQTVRELVAAVPGAHLVVVPGAGHDLPLSRPDVVAEAVGALVAGRRAR